MHPLALRETSMKRRDMVAARPTVWQVSFLITSERYMCIVLTYNFAVWRFPYDIRSINYPVESIKRQPVAADGGEKVRLRQAILFTVSADAETFSRVKEPM